MQDVDGRFHLIDERVPAVETIEIESDAVPD